VLVVEAGPSYVSLPFVTYGFRPKISFRNEDIFETRVPGLVGPLSLITRVQWNYTTTPQIGFNGRSVPYSRALVLGGCSSHSKSSQIKCVWDNHLRFVDGMGYTRGSRDDWDRWAKDTGDDGLSWDEMYPLLLQVGLRFP
jgi:choline dehydrogenase